jgi:putative ABC transport system substrate-binding protein
MKQNFFTFLYIFLISAITFTTSTLTAQEGSGDNNSPKPIKVAIANYGPHITLEESIKGFKQSMSEAGYIEGTNVTYIESHVNFDQTLIPQMLAQLKAAKPNLILTLTTPISLAAKHIIKDIPLVFTCITDPVAVGLVPSRESGGTNITGSSDIPNMLAVLNFAQRILPNAKKVGLLYSTSEANDTALKDALSSAAETHDMQFTAVGIDQSRDIPQRIQLLKDKADFLYVGTSGAIQPALPAIVANANRLKIPVINADSESVEQGLALGSFAVSYIKVGKNAATIALEIINGKSPLAIPPLYPAAQDHQAYLSKKVASSFNVPLPQNTTDIIVYP